MGYVYEDEDNNPMIESDLDRVMEYTVYSSREEMRAFDKCEYPEEKGEPDDGCWNCLNFDWRHEACTIGWNNFDESYYNPDTDDRELTDYCEYHDTDPDADPECLNYGGNEP